MDFSDSSLLTLGFQLPFIITVLRIQGSLRELSISLGVAIAQCCARASQEQSRDLNPCAVRGWHTAQQSTKGTASTAKFRSSDQLHSLMGFKLWHHLHLHNLWESQGVTRVEMRAVFALWKYFMKWTKKAAHFRRSALAKPRLLQKAFSTTFKDHSGKKTPKPTKQEHMHAKELYRQECRPPCVSFAKPLCSGTVQSTSASPHCVSFERRGKANRWNISVWDAAFAILEQTNRSVSFLVSQRNLQA